MIRAIAIPALIALICKLTLLGYTVRQAPRSTSMRLIQALLIIFVLNNSVEFIALIHFDGEVSSTIRHLGFAYLSFTILAAALILHLSLRLSLDLDSESSWLRIQPVLYVPGFALLYLLLATDNLVTGFQTYQGTVLRIPGRWYILFESYVVCYLLIALLSLVCGARASRKSAKGRSRNRLWLLALLPTGLTILYLIVANHFGVAKITSTIYLPIPWAFFLLVATYSVYHNRLPDVGVLIPGSKTRRRKAALYERARTMGVEIGNASSAEDMIDVLTRIFRCPVALVGDHTALRTRAHGQTTNGKGGERPERLPEKVLRNIREIVVMDEIEETDPELRALMKLHKVEAIVPFKPQGTGSTCWALFGERFGAEVHTPFDFRHVEILFRRIEECLGENILPLRARLVTTTKEIGELKHLLAKAWAELAIMRQSVDSAKAESQRLREGGEQQSDDRCTWESKLPESIASGEQMLVPYLRKRETEIVSAVLIRCRGDEMKAAGVLGISVYELRHIVERSPTQPT